MFFSSLRLGLTSLFFALSLAAISQVALAQAVPPAPAAGRADMSGVVQTDIDQTTLNSVNQGSSDTMPVDLTPVQLPSRTSALESAKEDALFHLPAQMFFSGTMENSIRLETNVFQTLHHQRQDMVYRVLPNVTLGYALTRKTRISANYFFLRDTYADHGHALSRNIQNVGFEIDHDFTLTNKTTLTTGFFARELFLTHSRPLNDLLPSATLVHRVSPASIVYGSVTGQLRWVDVLGEWQEGDQFYAIGTVYRKNLWSFSTNATLVDNFGKRRLRGGANNQIIILTTELDRQLSRKLPVVAFIEAQPIFNMGANESPGFAGFNFRLYGGLRISVAKPALFPVKVANHAIEQ